MKDSVNWDTLKIVNLIFAEHEYLSIENPLLKEQIKSLEELNQLYIKTDSVRKEELYEYEKQVNSDKETIKELRKTNKIAVGISAGSVFLFLISLIL